MKNILIVTGESSGELYGALLAKSIAKKTKDISIAGIGGIKMKQSGVNIISPISSAFGITEVFKSIKILRQTFKKISDYIHNIKPNVVILIDYPDFNLKVAKVAKKMNIPVLYYVSPQVWAWRKKRIYTIKKMINKIALILPFEVDIYKNIGVPCEFVGHPVLDDIEEFLNNNGFSLKRSDKEGLKTYMRGLLNINAKYVVALMPGSRRHEIMSLIQPIVESAVDIKKRYQDVCFVLPIAPNLDEQTVNIIENAIGPIKTHTTTIRDNPLIALACADVGIIASGTATFQATMLDVPMVVIYKVSRLSYMIGRFLIKVNYITLTNLLIEKTLNDSTLLKIKEIIQDDVTPENILLEVYKLLDDTTYYTSMIKTFSKVRDIFTNHSASERVSEIVLDMIKG